MQVETAVNQHRPDTTHEGHCCVDIAPPQKICSPAPETGSAPQPTATATLMSHVQDNTLYFVATAVLISFLWFVDLSTMYIHHMLWPSGKPGGILFGELVANVLLLYVTWEILCNPCAIVMTISSTAHQTVELHVQHRFLVEQVVNNQSFVVDDLANKSIMCVAFGGEVWLLVDGEKVCFISHDILSCFRGSDSMQQTVKNWNETFMRYSPNNC